MAKDAELFGIRYKEGSLEPKVSQLIRFAVNLAIGNESGVKHHLEDARKEGATDDEIWETVVYAMRPVTAQVRGLARRVINP